jgi:hypothetical protein
MNILLEWNLVVQLPKEGTLPSPPRLEGVIPPENTPKRQV